MAVMVLLALAHVVFWAWALVLGSQAGVTDAVGVGLVIVWLAFIGSWAAMVGQLSQSGWLTGAGTATWPALWISAPAVMVSVVALMVVPAFREAWIGSLFLLPPIAIPALNTLRILALGTVVKAARGQLPRRIGFGVGIPDMAFGLWSLTIALGGGFTDVEEEVAWHGIGAVILMMMIPAVFTALRSPRLNAPGKSDARAILRYPLVLAPAGLALPFLIIHAAVLFQYLTEGTLPMYGVS